jgi:hypothetical protein
MKRILALCMLLVVALPTLGVEGEQVMYVGGTIKTLKEGDLGRLDTTSQTTLTFEYSGGKAAIPFDKIDSFEYTQQVARHLGVLPAIAVGLVKRRQRKHFFRISYHEETNEPQVALFEVSKQMPQSLLAILQARAPQACKPSAQAKCGHVD